ncbi:MAG: DnaJ domain-containing protein [Paludibacteraceae bacterium]|nr:DnaJ domain-containing protein [Paludibacteraceae bacterium]
MTIEENIRLFFDSQRKKLDNNGALTAESTTKLIAYILAILVIVAAFFLILPFYVIEDYQWFRDLSRVFQFLIISLDFLVMLAIGVAAISLIVKITHIMRSKMSLYPDRISYHWFPFLKKKEILYSDISKIEVKTKKVIDTVSKHKVKIFSQNGTTISFDTKEIENKNIFSFFRSIFRTKVIDNDDFNMSYNSDVCCILSICAKLLKEDNTEQYAYTEEKGMVTDYILSNYFMGNEKFRKKVEERFNSLISSNKKQYHNPIRQILINGKMRYEERLSLFDLFFSLAYMSNGVNQAELKNLYIIARHLLIHEWDLINLEYKYECRKQEQKTEGQTAPSPASNILLNKAYEVLGLKSDATIDDVKNAYRRMAKECHPDTLPAKCNDDEREIAVARFRAITEAYDVLLKKS